VTLDNLKGKVWVADFIFTTCTMACPMMTGNMNIVHKKFKKNDNVRLVSISVYPEYDTPEVLKNYDVHINCARNGFFDKSVLETLSSEIINFYVNGDFNILFENNSYQFNDSKELVRKLDNLTNLSNEEIKNTIRKSKQELENNSLSSLNSRLEPYL